MNPNIIIALFVIIKFGKHTRQSSRLGGDSRLITHQNELFRIIHQDYTH